jgi:hypothetical protein
MHPHLGRLRFCTRWLAAVGIPFSASALAVFLGSLEGDRVAKLNQVLAGEGGESQGHAGGFLTDAVSLMPSPADAHDDCP